ncbi:MAG: ABC transporter permease [Planctomycetales bacterium]|nr:ABC transporter permease [Planctomycetales bacterium]
MPLWKIAWRSVRRRSLASILTALSMALGVMLVVAVLVIHGVVAESFRNNSSLGYNVILGAKGGDLQIVLNTVYYLSQPVENIPYTVYEDFLPADQRADGQKGKWTDFVTFAVPVCMGDYFGQYRVVGTTPDFFDSIVFDEDEGRTYQFAEGRNLQTWNEEHGFFEAVVGARVAQDRQLKVGDMIAPTHGSESGDIHDEFFVVGILEPTGAPNDRAVFVNMEGFYLLDGHAKPVKSANEDTDGNLADVSDNDDSNEPIAATAASPETTHDGPSHLTKRTPLPVEQRELTAILVRTISPVVTPRFIDIINEGEVARAVMPIKEITSLFSIIVQPIQTTLLVITALICVVSGISILVSIYNSMSDRHREIAIMRSLGAARRTVMVVVLWEAVILAVGGGFIGWATGHLGIGMFGNMIERRTGVQVSAFDLAPPVPLLRYSQPIYNLERTMGGSDAVRHMLDLLLSPEVMLVPAIVLLSIAVGFLPAITAYKTDVAKALSASP